MSRDTRPYITVTNELFRHPKYRRMSFEARVALLELWAHCNEFMTDGRVDGWVFEEYPDKICEQLLTVGWAYADGDSYEMHDYLKHQKSKAEILELKEKRSVSGAYAAHCRFHLKRGKPKSDCYWCNHPDETPNE